ncbi:pilus assembly protein PilP [Anaeromyxobacter sp. Red801]|uniref:pilus assembly protein PilP n=1 Tax=Anaeromyxobacter sp. Red801 TaxID=3411632 RepID=UPI003BA21E8C
MNRARLVAVAVAAVLAACGDPKPKRPGPAAQPAAAPAVSAAAEPTKPAPVDDWVYSSVGKRDPFRSFLADVAQAGNGLQTRCATPLGRFELDQLKLVAVVTGLEDPVAMVETPAGVGYAVRRGACLGKNGGTVAAVRSGELVVTEFALRADGTRDRTQTVLRLPKEAALNLEEQLP